MIGKSDDRWSHPFESMFISSRNRGSFQKRLSGDARRHMSESRGGQ
jgi:hypothetical protein